jgi:hypothetical protein
VLKDVASCLVPGTINEKHKNILDWIACTSNTYHILHILTMLTKICK